MSANPKSVIERSNKRAGECEEAVIGGLMLDNSALARVDLRPSDFLHAKHRMVYEAVIELTALGKPSDPLTVVTHLSTQGKHIDLRWAATIVFNTPSAANVASYAEVVRQEAQHRALREIGARMQSHDGNETPKFIDDTIRELMALMESKTDWTCHQYEAMQSAMDYMQKIASGEVGVSYGLRDVDDRIGGMQPEDLIVVGARPAMGKTAFMLNVAIGADVPTGIISGEQGRSQLGMRFISINGHVALHRMRKGILGDDEYARVTAVLNRLRDKPVWMFDKPGPSLDDIKRQARAWKFEKGIKLLMVDYLQKIKGGRGHTRDQEITDVASELKNLARELQIPVLALAQVNRGVEQYDLGANGLGRMPSMGDLRESGGIEAEADAVLTLYRPGVYLPDEPQHRGVAYINVCKSRHGPVGHVPVAWRGEFLQFGDLASTERE